MVKVIYWRLDPKELPRKYQLEDKISKILINIFIEKNKKNISKRSFSLEIKYFKSKFSYNNFNKVDQRWNKILSLLDFYQSSEFKKYKNYNNFYIDHDSFVNPFLLNLSNNYCNVVYNTIYNTIYNNIKRIPSFFIDFKILEAFHKTLKTNFISNLKNQEIQEEYILYDTIKKFSQLNHLNQFINIYYIILQLNSFIKNSFIIHYRTDFIHSFFIRNKNFRNLYKNIIYDLKELQEIYNEKI